VTEPNEVSKQTFVSFLERLEIKLGNGEFDEKRAGFTLTKILGDLADFKNSQTVGHRAGDKLSVMEHELEEIADNVRQGLDNIFQRGEKFGSLLSKSEDLKSGVS